jgi:thioredoxin 2
MAPVLERLAADRAGRLKVVKVDVDRAPAPAARFEVQGIPLLVLWEEGREIDRLTGTAPMEAAVEWLDRRRAR